jgi:recombination protein RecT
MNEVATNEVSTKIVIPAYGTLVKMEDLLSNIVPNEMCAKRLIRLFYVELSKSQKLNKCTVESICGAIMSCAQMGLEPGIAGMVYLIPRWDGDTRTTKLTVQLGYRGMIEMAYRTGVISTIKAFTVYGNDEFSIELGNKDLIIHKRKIGNKGQAIGYYAIVTMKDGEKHFDFMDIEDIEKVRARSKTPNEGPWISDYDQMAQKTVIRRILKLAPTSVNLNAGISFDEAHEYDGQNLDVIGKAALVEANIDTNVFEMQKQASQADRLADKLAGMGQ